MLILVICTCYALTAKKLYEQKQALCKLFIFNLLPWVLPYAS